VNDCEEALRLDKGMVKLHVRRGRALLRLGFLTPAEEAFKVVLGTEVRDLLTPREMQDAELVDNTQSSLEGNKSNATLGVKDIAKLRESIRNLTVLEGQSRFKEALKVSEDVLKLAPYCRIAHISKASAMCELLQYDDCKSWVDEITSQTHVSIQSMHAHPNAVFPAAAPSELQWREAAAEKCVRTDLPSTIAFLLCMGSELGSVYLTVLKNIGPNRAYSADMMGKLATLLRGLASKVTAAELRAEWRWVQSESDKITCLLGLKSSADEKFKGKNFKAAVLAYSNALKVRTDNGSLLYGLCNRRCVGSVNIILHLLLIPLCSGGPQRQEVERDPAQQPRRRAHEPRYAQRRSAGLQSGDYP
jgi:hypothetical protein